MNFKDQWATDENGNRFIFTVEMQRQLRDAGLPVTPDSLAELDVPVPAKSNPPAQQYGRSDGPKSEEMTFTPPETIQIDPQSGKYIGRMKWYNEKKGYGFLVRGAGEEIFFHKTSTVGEPTSFAEGQWVLYDVEETKKGPEATDIEPYSGDVTLLA
jgi:CspA family cold shock protein